LLRKTLLGCWGEGNNYLYVPNPTSWVDPFELTSKPGDCTLFRGDGYYDDCDLGKPLESDADIITPWDHVRRESNESSIYTSFATTKNKTSKFTKNGNVYKVSMDDMKKLESESIIKIHTADDVANSMKRHSNKK